MPDLSPAGGLFCRFHHLSLVYDLRSEFWHMRPVQYSVVFVNSAPFIHSMLPAKLCIALEPVQCRVRWRQHANGRGISTTLPIHASTKPDEAIVALL